MSEHTLETLILIDLVPSPFDNDVDKDTCIIFFFLEFIINEFITGSIFFGLFEINLIK